MFMHMELTHATVLIPANAALHGVPQWTQEAVYIGFLASFTCYIVRRKTMGNS